MSRTKLAAYKRIVDTLFDNSKIVHFHSLVVDTTQQNHIRWNGRRKDGDQRDWPFRRCQFRDSKTTLPLQLVDIITGALAFVLNGHDKAENASPSKIAPSKYVLDRAGIVDVRKDTARAATFTVWHRRLKRGVSQP